MQNSFVAPDAVFETRGGRRIIPNIDKLVAFAGTHGLPVIWTQSDHSPPGGGRILDLYPEMVQPVEGEHRVVKHKYDAFHDTDLDTVLKNYGMDTVVIAGVASEVCCESTARAAFFHEHKVVFLRDATAAFAPELQDQICDRIDNLFARVLTTDELISILEQRREQ